MSKWKIILHWTAGADGVIPVEADSYHFIVGRDGKISYGDHRIVQNVPPLARGAYAAHTLNCNSYAIGIAMDAMAGAVERPFNAGRYPITREQVLATCALAARLCKEYDIPVERDRVLSHAEVQPTLGIQQRNKWDITWLPGMDKPGDPVVVGDILREMIRGMM